MGKDAYEVLRRLTNVVDSKTKMRVMNKRLSRMEYILKRDIKRDLGRHDRWQNIVESE